MSITHLLQTLDQRQLTLALDGDELLVRGEKSRLDSVLVAQLRSNKAALIALIERGQYQAPASAPSVPPNLVPAGATALRPEMLPLVALTQPQIDLIAAAVPGGAANIQDIYPLAPLQEGIFFHHLLATEGDPYLGGMLMAFDSRARLDDYLAALQAVIARHDILRTVFLWEGLPQPVQVVLRRARLPVRELTLDAADGDLGAQLRASHDPRHCRLDLRQAPLARACVAHDAARGRWLLLQQFHHLIGDHTASQVMLAEVDAHLSGRFATLAPPVPFRNFVARTRQQVSQAEHEAFFRAMLADVDEPSAPFGMLDLDGGAEPVEDAQLRLDGEFGRRLHHRARQCGVSVASVVHLAFAQVLAGVSGRGDVVFGTVLFGRMQAAEGAVDGMGLFINTLPLRVTLGQGAQASLQRMQLSLAELMRHEHAPLALAQRCSGVAAPAPLFCALLNYRHSRPAAADGGPARWQGIEILHSREGTNYPLTLSVDELGEHGLVLSAQVRAPAGALRFCHMLRCTLEGLLDALERQPHAPVGGIEMAPPAERALVAAANATDADVLGGLAGPALLHGPLLGQIALRGDAPAVRAADRSLSYRELGHASAALAARLAQGGARPNHLIAVVMDKGWQQVVAVLAILRAGGAYLPVDAGLPPARIVQLLRLGEVGQVVATPDVLARLELDREWRVHAVDAALLAGPAAAAPAVASRPQDLAYVIFTSGSTGTPKGVVIDHRGALNTVLDINQRYAVGHDDAVLGLSSLNFDLSVYDIFGVLGAGGTLVLPHPGQLRDPHAWLALLLAHRVTLWNTVPALMQMLAEVAPAAGVPLRVVMMSGDWIPIDLPARLRRMAPTARLISMGGATEASIWSISYEIGHIDPAWRSVPYGRALANQRFYVLHPEGLTLAPVGVTGALYIGGVGVALGYWRDEALTAASFIVHPASGERLYRTGDMGRLLADGNIEFLGRLDHQVKIKGFRIELGEIEARLLEHAGVAEAVVLAREDRPGERRLVAYVVGAPDRPPLAAPALRAHVAARLPDYMVPAAYLVRERIALTANGKVDRKALPAPADADGPRAGQAPPRGATEAAIAAVWCQALGLERVGRDDDFFELGGHSLLAVQVVSALGQAGVDLTIAELFKHRRLAALAALAEQRRPPAAVDAALALRPEGAQAPLFLLHDGTASHLYAVALAPCLRGDMPVYALPAPELDAAPLQTMEGMAARMVRLIRAVQPRGPYRLAGYCVGGVLAYEVAAQLLGEDEQVDFLGLLDSSYAPSHQALAAVGSLRDYVLALMGSVVADDAPRAALLARLAAETAQAPLTALLAGAAAAGLVPAPLDALAPPQLERTLARRYAIGFLAVERYQVHPLPIPVHFFSAGDDDPAHPLRGWERVLPAAGVRLRVVGGGHASMLQAPHLAALAGALDAALAEAPAPAPGRYDPLVTLQHGQPGRAPLFCVPGAGANVVGFAALAGALDAAQPVQAFQPRGVDGVQPPHSSVAAAARCYAAALRTACPHGPLHLLGHSFGGWIALEMALQLRAQGREIASLTIVDSAAPQSQAAPEVTDVEAMLQLIEIYEQAAERPMGLDGAALRALAPHARRARLHAGMVALGLLPARSAPALLAGPLRTFAACVRTGYQPAAPYPAPLHLILLDDPRLDAEANGRAQAASAAHWRRWAPQLRWWRGPGNHMTALDAPRVAELAQWIATQTGVLAPR